MANIPHVTLTTTDLHEPKDVAGATANQIYVTDGAGSGDMTDISALNPFGSGLLHIRTQLSSGTSGAALTANTWNTRTLTTAVVNQISGASIGSNQIVLPDGDFFIQVNASVASVIPASGTLNFRGQLRLRNITGSATSVVGTTCMLGPWNSGVLSASTQNNAGSVQTMTGKFTLGVTSTLELQNYLIGNLLGPTEGLPITSGENEVYTDIMIWKLT